MRPTCDECDYPSWHPVRVGNAEMLLCLGCIAALRAMGELVTHVEPARLDNLKRPFRRRRYAKAAA